MLPPKQLEFYNFLKGYLAAGEAQGKRPSEGEIAAGLGISQPMVHKYLRALARKGLLYFGRFRPYGFVVRLHSTGTVRAVMAPLLGAFDRDGIVQQFTEQLWETVLVRTDREETVFILTALDDVPELGVWQGDFLVFEPGAGLLGGTAVALQDATGAVRLMLAYVGETGANPNDPEQQDDFLRVDSYSFAPPDVATRSWHVFRPFRSSSANLIEPIFHELASQRIKIGGTCRRLFRELA